MKISKRDLMVVQAATCLRLVTARDTNMVTETRDARTRGDLGTVTVPKEREQCN